MGQFYSLIIKKLKKRKIFSIFKANRTCTAWIMWTVPRWSRVRYTPMHNYAWYDRGLGGMWCAFEMHSGPSHASYHSCLLKIVIWSSIPPPAARGHEGVACQIAKKKKYTLSNVSPMCCIFRNTQGVSRHSVCSIRVMPLYIRDKCLKVETDIYFMRICSIISKEAE